jgi:Ca2+-binding RTX toxin-like protein
MLEQLESRQLMSASFNSTTGLVQVVGTSADDKITFTKTQNLLIVNENNTSIHAFDIAKVKKIFANGMAGCDKITVDASITIPAELHGGGCVSVSYPDSPGWKKDDLKGGSGNDTLYADGSAALFSGAGNDTIYFGGNCFANGEEGNDKLIRLPGGGNYSNAFGGPGNDTFSVEKHLDGQILGNYWDLQDEDIDLDAEFYRLDGGKTFANEFENFVGGAGSDSIYGNAGNNILKGNGGNDRIYGRAGNDKIFGGDGNDYLVGEAGYDEIYGGNDNDFIDSRDGYQHDLVDGGGGYDKATVDIFDVPAASIEKYL